MKERLDTCVGKGQAALRSVESSKLGQAGGFVWNRVWLGIAMYHLVFHVLDFRPTIGLCFLLAMIGLQWVAGICYREVCKLSVETLPYTRVVVVRWIPSMGIWHYVVASVVALMMVLSTPQLLETVIWNGNALDAIRFDLAMIEVSDPALWDEAMTFFAAATWAYYALAWILVFWVGVASAVIFRLPKLGVPAQRLYLRWGHPTPTPPKVDWDVVALSNGWTGQRRGV